jgi:pimeloyl-ACP methyl ester carboxylesterase
MVKTVTDILDSIPGKAIIVVHSRNGIVASRAAELRPQKVEKLIYLASFMLKNGERAADWFFSDKQSLLQGQVDIHRLQITDMIQQSAYREALYADCSDDDVALAYALLTPEPSWPALTRVTLTEKNYGSIPRYYIELTQDRAVSISLQRRLIAQQSVRKVYSLDASHSAYFSKPDELVKIVLEIEQAGSSLGA